MYLKISSIDAQSDVVEALVFKQEAQVIGKSTLGDLKLDGVWLTWNIDTISDDAHLSKSHKQKRR